MYVQVVFAVKNRNAVLRKDIRFKIFEYISGIVRDLGHKSLNVNGVSDHVHILFGINPAVSISKTVQEIKRGSSLFINENKLCGKKFAWQAGYGGFTYSRSQIGRVYKYIENQERHHELQSFRKEYLRYLKTHQIEYDERFLFEFWDD